MNLRQRVVVIGCGGIGNWLLPPLARYMNYTKTQEWVLVLVDGDSYSPANTLRQNAEGLGNKALDWKSKLKIEFPRLEIIATPQYVTNLNNRGKYGGGVPVHEIIRPRDIVFMAVDNHPTRLIVSEHCQRLSTVFLVDGSNDGTEGSVFIYIRINGKNLTPPIEKYHQEMLDEVKHEAFPLAERGCEAQIEEGDTQLIFTNNYVSANMLGIFWLILEDPKIVPAEVHFSISHIDVRTAKRGPTVKMKHWQEEK